LQLIIADYYNWFNNVIAIYKVLEIPSAEKGREFEGTRLEMNENYVAASLYCQPNIFLWDITSRALVSSCYVTSLLTRLLTIQ
jgi:hypothetical protein